MSETAPVSHKHDWSREIQVSGILLRQTCLRRRSMAPAAGRSVRVLRQNRRRRRLRLVRRKVYPVIPPKVEYSLTPRGRSLAPILSSLCDWGEAHRDDTDVLAATPDRAT